ncbi:unnamed protein product [Staurois parvus]|uniref:Uncharacterized protein n=1 Tax=Staurois parvus TaxID=386267 RepID=A0ABN9GC84_9NEOB|nr:unnamed protein product [Staurois parvus]
MQIDAVDLRITAHFTHLGSHGAKTSVEPQCGGGGSTMGGHTAPYDKMEPTSSVRRPESGTWQSVAMETAAMEAVQGPMTDSGPGSSMRRRYRGPGPIGLGSQHEEAVQGPHGRVASV